MDFSLCDIFNHIGVIKPGLATQAADLKKPAVARDWNLITSMGFCSPVTRHLADFVYRRLPPLNSNHIRILASRNCSDKGCRQLRFSLSTQKGQMETDLCGGKA